MSWYSLRPWRVSVHRPCLDAHGHAVQLIRNAGLGLSSPTVTGAGPLRRRRTGDVSARLTVGVTHTVPFYDWRKLLLLQDPCRTGDKTLMTTGSWLIDLELMWHELQQTNYGPWAKYSPLVYLIRPAKYWSKVQTMAWGTNMTTTNWV